MTTMLDFQIPQITAEDVDEHRGVFTVEPLDRGFGYTFGNSLRRVLLSSLEGCAVTSVKIEGVQHEFTTIPGVREDVTDIILNLKGLSCRLHGEAPEIEADISKDGPGVVTAADIVASADLEILNPELVICHLSGRRALRDDAHHRPWPRLPPGRDEQGLRDDDRRDPGRLDLLARPPRDLPRRHARVGQRTDFDKLTLDVKTNGAVNPKDAVTQAAELLIRQLAIFTTLDTAELLPASRPRCRAPSPTRRRRTGWRTS